MVRALQHPTNVTLKSRESRETTDRMLYPPGARSANTCTHTLYGTRPQRATRGRGATSMRACAELLVRNQQTQYRSHSHTYTYVAPVVACVVSTFTHIRYSHVHTSSNSAVAPCDAQSHQAQREGYRDGIHHRTRQGDAGELSFGVNVHTRRTLAWGFSNLRRVCIRSDRPISPRMFTQPRGPSPRAHSRPPSLSGRQRYPLLHKLVPSS